MKEPPQPGATLAQPGATLARPCPICTRVNSIVLDELKVFCTHCDTVRKFDEIDAESYRATEERRRKGIK